MSSHDAVSNQERVLFNPLILENLFKYFSSKDISQCRLVCRYWLQVSTPFWSAKAGPITLYEHSRDAVFERNKHMTLATFVDTYKRSSNNDLSLSGWPYSRFKLLFFRDLGCGPSNRMKQFWMDCGAWITELQLFGCRLHDFGVYKDVILCKHTPNVKNFKFSCQYDGAVELETSDPGTCNRMSLKSLSFLYCIPKIGWMELLSQYPNMTSFELFSPYPLANWENELVKMMDCIKTLRMNNEQVLSLKSLDIRVAGLDQNPGRDEATIGISDLLANSKLPLESLCLDARLFRGEANRHQLANLFGLYRATLQKLKLRDSLCESPTLTFPSLVMNSLKELIITGGSFSSLEFLKFTPNLILLHVVNPLRSRSLDRYMFKGAIKSTEHFKLESLHDFRYDFDCTPCNMMNLVCWMPNVKVLEMPLTNETFRTVCKYWKRLKHLVVQKGALNDDGICGVTGSDEKLVNMTSKFKEHQLVKPQPDITDLKGIELRSFVMENHRYNRNEEMENCISHTDMLPTKLSERSILHGFLKLPRLEKLSITVEADTISPQLLATLEKRIRQVDVMQLDHPYGYLRH